MRIVEVTRLSEEQTDRITRNNFILVLVARRHNGLFIVGDIFLIGIFIQDFLFYLDFFQGERLGFCDSFKFRSHLVHLWEFVKNLWKSRKSLQESESVCEKIWKSMISVKIYENTPFTGRNRQSSWFHTWKRSNDPKIVLIA